MRARGDTSVVRRPVAGTHRVLAIEGEPTGIQLETQHRIVRTVDTTEQKRTADRVVGDRQRIVRAEPTGGGPHRQEISRGTELRNPRQRSAAELEPRHHIALGGRVESQVRDGRHPPGNGIERLAREPRGIPGRNDGERGVGDAAAPVLTVERHAELVCGRVPCHARVAPELG